MAKKGKKTTPPGLDKYFQRQLIKESQYKEFWPKYWKAKKIGAEDSVINRWFPEKKEPGAVLPKPERIIYAAPIRKTVASAERELRKAEKQTGEKFHLVRRDRFGRFNSRGRSYQAIRNGSKKK